MFPDFGHFSYTVIQITLTFLVPQVLIQWENLDALAAMWEDKSEMGKYYHDFNLEDKVDFKGMLL